ncbi:MAG: hypothetical protein SH868_19475 [Bythopirellula sp.]|nr:hypothetical protein [Bythopirellula sp.]
MSFIKVRRAFVAALTMTGLVFCIQTVSATDTFFLQSTPGSTGDWNVPGNWSNGSVPDYLFEDRAVIENGNTANLSAAAAAQTGGVALGLTLNSTGTLNINPGGTLTSRPSVSTNGNFEIGPTGGGVGILNMTGGTLTVGVTGALAQLQMGNNALNQLNLSGSATINTSNAQLGGTTRVTGPSVNFNPFNFTLQGPSALIAGITGPTHSALKASGIATIGGTLAVEFTGVTPAFGQTWNIVDAPAIAGTFTNAGNVPVTGLAVPPALGEVYRVTKTAGGTFGTVLQLSRQKALVLQVNRDTGAVAILNPQDGAINIDGYRISSAAGSLEFTGGTWNSLTDQSTPGWVEAFASGNTLGELNIGSTLNFSGLPSKSLGNAYDDRNAFFSGGLGALGTDLVFTYSEPGNPNQIFGQVVYEGAGRTNSLILSIDPTDGQATLINDAPGAISLEGLSILSDATALVPGNYIDSATPNITVPPGINTTSAISELVTNPANPFVLAGDATFNLGNIFNTASPQSGITFEFVRPGENLVRTGLVVFEEATGQDGDFDGDGDVDGRDFLVWQRGGSPTPFSSGDLALWQTNYGVGPLTASVNSVPEPSSISLVMLMICTTCALRFRDRG